MNVDYTLWPNNGSLGENKIQIPDGVDTPWPEGDILVRNFVYKNGKLVGFVDNKALINNDTSSTVIPYDYIDICLDRCLEDELNITTGERCKYLNIKFVDILPKGYKKLPYLETSGPQRLVVDLNLATAGIDAVITPLYTLVNDFPFSWQTEFGGPNANSYRNIRWSNIGVTWWDAGRMEIPQTGKGKKSHIIGNFKNNHKLSIQYEGLYSEIQLGEVTYCYATKAVFGGIMNWKTDGTYTSEFASTLRMHHIALSEGTKIKYNLIPALDETGAPCMYDSITHTSFYNSGRGDFLYPNMNTQSTYSLRERKYAKMTEHGIKRLYKVPDGVDKSKDEYAMANGFKELVENTIPHEGNWIPQWTETETQLICNWIETEDLSEETI